MKFRTATAAACLLALLPLGSSPALAADPPIHLGEGTLLGPRLEPDPPVQILSATSKYYLTDYGRPADFAPAPWSVRSAVDGTAKGEYQRNDPEVKDPEIVGEYALQEFPGAVLIRRVGTDTVQTIYPPLGFLVHDVYPGGMLLNDEHKLVLRTFAGVETPVTGVTSKSKVLDRTEESFLLGTETGLFVLDIATGTTTRVATPATWTEWAQLTPGRIIWQTSDTATTTTLAWKDRTGTAEGTTVVPFKQPLLPLGDDVAVQMPDSKELVKVELQDGTVTRNLVTGLHDAADQGNGRLLVTAQSQVASIGVDGVLQPIAQTPPFRGQSDDVMLSGGKVVTSTSQPPQDGLVNSPLAAINQTTDLGATWTTAAVKTDRADRAPEFAGDALLTYRELDGAGMTAMVTDVRGTFPLSTRVAQLGRGGKLVGRLLRDSTNRIEVIDVTARKPIGTFPGPVGLNGETVWTGPDERDDLIATSSGFEARIDAGPGCGRPSSIQAAGRWVVVDCEGADRIVDAGQQVPPRTITLTAGWKLGFNFLVQHTRGSGAAQLDLRVTDLNALNLPERRYGPIAGHSSTRISFAPDDANVGRLIYKDRDLQPRIVTLDWLAPQPTVDTDHVAPVLASGDAGPRYQASQAVSFSFTFKDPGTPEDPASGLVDYDIRYQDRTSPTAPYGAWIEPPFWQKLNKQTNAVQHHATPGTDTCFQGRARDRAGNLGEWSQSYCTEVDGTAPALTSSSAGERVITAVVGSFKYAFADNSGKVASYDVVYRDALAGQANGKWQYPAAWQATTATSVTWAPVAGVDRCFMVRARDAAGNLSGWSAPVCAAAPQDDRALTATGTVTRTTSSITYKGTISQLKATGAALAKTGEAGVRVALVTVNGPGQGSVDVYHAGVKVGRVSLVAPSSKVTVTLLPVTPFRSGDLKIVSVGAAQATIDGVALLRN
ncbi:hypothetical protein [Kribbella sp. CA-293567]|uniref:hypothetical protein n=1 Tax=Kribbella sp. CA-293567 TaxID=3002436 RepID=UPI0022DD1A58|nr:hypothetical protein [Kribbella sp. CA-293567]WBQ03282.1 hypothetical protein OX958_25290 [Kribbella sp. CA-293567]